MKIGMHIILCMHAVWLQTQPYLRGKFMRGLGKCIFLASATGAPHSLAGFACAI